MTQRRLLPSGAAFRGPGYYVGDQTREPEITRVPDFGRNAEVGEQSDLAFRGNPEVQPVDDLVHRLEQDEESLRQHIVDIVKNQKPTPLPDHQLANIAYGFDGESAYDVSTEMKQERIREEAQARVEEVNAVYGLDKANDPYQVHSTNSRGMPSNYEAGW